MIKSFKCKETKRIFEGQFSKKLPHDIQRQAGRKLVMLHAAFDLNDLRIPPANRLEALGGDRQGQHSVRVNNRWRICFEWRDDGAHSVEMVDYH